MKVLFLTMVAIDDINTRGIYQDLLREFVKHGHQVSIVTPVERRYKKPTQLFKTNGTTILRVQTLNIKRVNIVEKGIGTIAIEYQFLRAIKKHFKTVQFDLVLYSTPPITFYKVIKFIKERDNAYSYLLLKDIFPQNAVDMKMIKKGSLLHKYFESKEKRLYIISDTIGCMSQANVDYLKKNHSYLSTNKIEVNPNSIEPISIEHTLDEKMDIRKKYGLPLEKSILLYGGNLGKPQGLSFLLECIEKVDNPNYYFLIVGDGTEFSRIEKWFSIKNPKNAILINRLPKHDYDILLNACDIGLIFLSTNFTIPNFPSRLLPYLEMEKPIITVTDATTDIGDIVEAANCGFKVLSGDVESFKNALVELESTSLYQSMSNNAIHLLYDQFLVDRSYKGIINSILD